MAKSWRLVTLGVVLWVILVLSSCTKDNARLANLGLESVYFTTRFEPVIIDCALKDGEHTWRLLGVTRGGSTSRYEEGAEPVMSFDPRVVLVYDTVGLYHYELEYRDAENLVVEEFRVLVEKEHSVFNEFSTRVYDYRPAPGTDVNLKPHIMSSELSQEDVNGVCARALSAGKSVTLGGFGGYIVVGFDHMVVNVPGRSDFAVYSPAKRAAPGVIQVAYDANSNGVPDDPWYTIQDGEGSLVGESLSVTYYYSPKPVGPQVSAPKDGFPNPRYIRAVTGVGQEFYIPCKDESPSNEYWPIWLTDSDKELTYQGRVLSDLVTWEVKSDGTPFNVTQDVVWPGFFADNRQSEESDFEFDISDAVTDAGEPALLDGINFIRIYTGVNQQIPFYGGLSTEIVKIKDLHYAREKAKGE